MLSSVNNLNLDITPYQYNVIPLEVEFEEELTQEERESKSGFTDYIYPNEGSPEGIIKHLELAKPGIMVCTGAERSFFNLILIDETKCFGLVIRDLNPRVKAYVDFNTALIRISKTCDEYARWTLKISDPDELSQAINAICGEIVNSSMPENMKDYYIKNAQKFGGIYFEVDKSWMTNEYFRKVFYAQDDLQYQKIKRYADAGNIISTIGQINDLLFLKNRNIAVVDTSNICDYSMIDLNGGEDFNPRVIWTKMFFPYFEVHGSPMVCPVTKYYSYTHCNLNKNDYNKIKKLINKICRAVFATDATAWINKNMKKLDNDDEFSSDVGPFYTLNMLNKLEEFVNEHIIEVVDLWSPILITNNDSLKTINYLKTDNLFKLINSKEIKPFILLLVQRWELFKPTVNLALSYVEEWRNEFENRFEKPFSGLDRFLDHLKTGKVLDDFICMYGKERLESLKKSNLAATQQIRYQRANCG